MTNRIHDAFDSIKADERQKEAAKRFLRESLREKAGKNSRLRQYPAVKYAVSAVCAMLFLVIGGVGFSWVRMPVSYVSIDVNPSIELGLNRFDRVVSAEAYNVEGEEILSGLPLKWKKYKDAIDAVIGCDKMRAYLTDAPGLVLTVAADSEREAYLTEGVKECASHVEGGCHNTQADINMAPRAHESGLSCGKYNAWLTLRQYDSSITIEDCREMSMAQIQEKLREYETDDGSGGDAGSTGTTWNGGSAGDEGTVDNGESDVGGGDSGDYGNGHHSSAGQKGHHHRGGTHE